MKHTIENIESEVVNFVIARLENFKRIHYGYLAEVVKNKFLAEDVDLLLKENLIKTNRAKLKKGYLIMACDTDFYTQKRNLC